MIVDVTNILKLRHWFLRESQNIQKIDLSFCCLQGNEARIYEFIVRHFLACCSQDAQGQETTIEIAVNSEVVRKVFSHIDL